MDQRMQNLHVNEHQRRFDASGGGLLPESRETGFHIPVARSSELCCGHASQQNSQATVEGISGQAEFRQNAGAFGGPKAAEA
jgi:hypothetical protein